MLTSKSPKRLYALSSSRVASRFAAQLIRLATLALRRESCFVRKVVSMPVSMPVDRCKSIENYLLSPRKFRPLS